MRPINNVVDVSNYVMLELSQPNHAYDLTTLAGGFRIRHAAEGERITTLDGQERVLTAADLLVCNGDDRPVGGLAGVMGGLDTEIGDATSVVALEMAWFEPIGIAQTVARHALRSEASARFERGVDPYGMPLAVARFAELLAETCPGLTVHAGAADARGESLPVEERTADVRISQVNRILGTELAADDLPPLLDPIGYTVTGTGDVRTVALPTWRPDSTAEVDVIEEVARHYGYERLGKTVPKSVVHGGLSVRQQRRRLAREVLLGLGISEAMPNPFLGPDTLEQAGLPTESLRVTNPLVSDESVLRTSLRPGLLQSIAYNESHRRSGVRLFEIGHVYPPGEGELPNEYESLAVVLAGAEAPDAIAVWRELADALGTGARIDQSKVPAGMHPTRSAVLQAGREPLGGVGEVHPAVLDPIRRDRTSGDPRDRPGSTPRPRAEADPMEAHQPVPVERSRPRVRRARDRRGRAGRQGDPAGRRQAPRRRHTVRRVPRGSSARRHALARLPLAVAGAGPEPHRRRHRRGAAGRRGRGDKARCRPAKLTR